MSKRKQRRELLGDEVCALAARHAAIMNATEFATSLRTQRLTKNRLISYVSAMYPIVVGFNRALVRSMSKLDVVSEYGLLKSLTAQLKDELLHNQLWRDMLEVYGVAHGELYTSLLRYMEKFSENNLDRMTAEVTAAIRENPHNVAPGIFPGPVFPEPVLSLYHRLWMTANASEVEYWEHFGAQFGIEAVIYDVVSISIYPGVRGNPELYVSPATLRWWGEHAKQGRRRPDRRSTEEKHIGLARVKLNKSRRAAQLHDQVLSTAQDAIRLFTSTMICHDIDKVSFDVQPFLEGRGKKL